MWLSRAEVEGHYSLIIVVKHLTKFGICLLMQLSEMYKDSNVIFTLSLTQSLPSVLIKINSDSIFF